MTSDSKYIPCWTLTNCPPENRDKCIAYVEQLQPCWETRPDTRCPVAGENTSCEVCKVYHANQGSESRVESVTERKLTTVLVVDDEMLIRWSLCQALQRFGFTVSAAADGEEACRKLKDKMFDVVLVDMRMPGKDGLEIAEECLRLGPYSRVVLMTAYGTPEVRARAESMGISFVSKPLDIDYIAELLRL
jgi:CheY-like chemotaxis protein